jgi:hypothetical protein
MVDNTGQVVLMRPAVRVDKAGNVKPRIEVQLGPVLRLDSVDLAEPVELENEDMRGNDDGVWLSQRTWFVQVLQRYSLPSASMCFRLSISRHIGSVKGSSASQTMDSCPVSA